MGYTCEGENGTGRYVGGRAWDMQICWRESMGQVDIRPSHSDQDY